MSRENMMQHWTEAQVQAAIATALENEPDGPNKEYWTTECTVQDIRVKYGLKKFKPNPLTVTLVRECCGENSTTRFSTRKRRKGLADWRCFDIECRLKVLVMPFGKFAGKTLPWIYEKSPSYLAWFHETVQGCEEIKEAIRGLDGIEAHLMEFRERPREPKRLTPTQEQVEWLMGKFTTPTIDAVCIKLFNGEE